MAIIQIHRSPRQIRTVRGTDTAGSIEVAATPNEFSEPIFNAANSDHHLGWFDDFGGYTGYTGGSGFAGSNPNFVGNGGYQSGSIYNGANTTWVVSATNQPIVTDLRDPAEAPHGPLRVPADDTDFGYSGAEATASTNLMTTLGLAQQYFVIAHEDTWNGVIGDSAQRGIGIPLGSLADTPSDANWQLAIEVVYRERGQFPDTNPIQFWGKTFDVTGATSGTQVRWNYEPHNRGIGSRSHSSAQNDPLFSSEFDTTVGSGAGPYNALNPLGVDQNGQTTAMWLNGQNPFAWSIDMNDNSANNFTGNPNYASNVDTVVYRQNRNYAAGATSGRLGYIPNAAGTGSLVHHAASRANWWYHKWRITNEHPSGTNTAPAGGGPIGYGRIEMWHGPASTEGSLIKVMDWRGFSGEAHEANVFVGPRTLPAFTRTIRLWWLGSPLHSHPAVGREGVNEIVDIAMVRVWWTPAPY